MNTFTRKDLSKLRWSLVLLTISLSISGLAVLSSRGLETTARSAFKQQEQQSKDVRSKLNGLRSEENEMRNKIALFNNLSARGIVGNEQRLDWVELLRSEEKTRKLLGMEYEIAPQQPLSAAQLPGSSASHEFMVSSMHLRLPLLHENDLLLFMDDLRNNAKAFVRPAECKMTRNTNAANPAQQRSLSAQLLAECKVDWVTLKERDKK